MTEWIPVDERLPEIGQKVLVQLDTGGMAIIKFTDARLLSHVLAWMPLPKRYKK